MLSQKTDETDLYLATYTSNALFSSWTIDSTQFYNINGIQVLSTTLDQNQQDIILRALPTGVYVLKIQTDKGIISEKFIKQ